MAQNYHLTQEDVAFMRRLALNSDNPIDQFAAAEAEKHFVEQSFEDAEQVEE
jgi:hypothetical protein